MSEYDGVSNVKVVEAVPAAVIVATTTTGVEVDTLGFESCTFVLQIGAAALDGSFTVAVQEDSATGMAGATAVPADNVIGDLPVLSIGDQNKLFRVGTRGKARFQRIVLTETAANSTGIISALAILGHPKSAPVAAQST